MFVVFVILTVIVSVLMILIVLVQKSKGGGLSSQFGGGNQVLGVRGTNTFLEKTTWTLAVLILVLSVCCAYTMPSTSNETAVRANAKEVATAPAAQGNTFDTKAAPKEAPAAAAPAPAAAAPAAEAAAPAAAPAADAKAAPAAAPAAEPAK